LVPLPDPGPPRTKATRRAEGGATAWIPPLPPVRDPRLEAQRDQAAGETHDCQVAASAALAANVSATAGGAANSAVFSSGAFSAKAGRERAKAKPAAASPTRGARPAVHAGSPARSRPAAGQTISVAAADDDTLAKPPDEEATAIFVSIVP